MQSKIILSISLLFPSLTFAFFCPTNFSQINMGDSIEQVTQICGKPDQQETKDAEENVPQEWTYFAPQQPDSLSRSTQQGIGTMKVVITFDETGKAMNMTVNGIGVNATRLCGKDIVLGDSRDSVKSACGDPKFVVKQQATSGTPQPANKVVTYIYNSNPPVKLIFEGGKLTQRQ